MLTKLSHPSILSLYGVSGNDRGDLYMVMEYCGGGDLAHYLKTPAFNNSEFVRICYEFISGVHFLHSKSIAHRDLKVVALALGAHFTLVLLCACLTAVACFFGPAGKRSAHYRVPQG
jgi:protein-serine/threonine kinase